MGRELAPRTEEGAVQVWGGASVPLCAFLCDAQPIGLSGVRLLLCQLCCALLMKHHHGLYSLLSCTRNWRNF